MSHPFLTVVHVLAAVLFLGNITVSAVWKRAADRSPDAAVRAFGCRLALRTDLLFSLPTSVVLILTGILRGQEAWGAGAGFLKHPWVHIGLGVLILVIALWHFVLLPIQRKQLAMAEEAVAGGTLSDRYDRLGRTWNLVGALCVLLVLAVLFMMVTKHPAAAVS
ncbi:MAG: DUF2269 family protein [Planctomycetota bacterium]